MTVARRVCIVTGSRAEWGLLRTVADAVVNDPAMSLQLVVCGSHLLPPAETWREVGPWPIAAKVAMQEAGSTGRIADAVALGRGVSGFAEVFRSLAPDWVVVLGDRIEAFAAASAASVGGWGVAHIHGGDRAEGIADEAMRHAITKLAHLHLAATSQSAERIRKMGEQDDRVHVTGSPAVDGLAEIPVMDDAAHASLGGPEVVVLLHPAGLVGGRDGEWARCISSAVHDQRVLWLSPNHDAGRDEIVSVMKDAAAQGVRTMDHLPRERFVGLLKRLARDGGVLVGNSSAGLIEAAVLRCPAVDVGPRQGGRERPNNVVHIDDATPQAVVGACAGARALERRIIAHPYGEPGVGGRIASLLKAIDPAAPGFLRKRNAY